MPIFDGGGRPAATLNPEAVKATKIVDSDRHRSEGRR
jgi:hypothetical protein